MKRLIGGPGASGIVVDNTGRISFPLATAALPGLYPGTDTNTGMWSPAADTLAWSTGGVERGRVSSTGMWSVNTALAEGSPYFDGKFRVVNSGTAVSFGTSGTEATFALRGTITYNRAAGLVSYNTTSDYRSKVISGSIGNSGATIDALKVYRGVMNGATIERPMLIAHEAQEVAPYCVTGEKDAVNDNGDPIYQQIDHQVLVPLLIAEVQQLRARVAVLENV